LPKEDQRELQGHVQVFLAEKSFEGCGGLIITDDGRNVVFHEFAHQLDFEDGRADGAPVLGRGDAWSGEKSRYAAWARVLSAEFEKQYEWDFHEGWDGGTIYIGTKGVMHTGCYGQRPRLWPEAAHRAFPVPEPRYRILSPRTLSAGIIRKRASLI
jgi:hypothetical protein